MTFTLDVTKEKPAWDENYYVAVVSQPRANSLYSAERHRSSHAYRNEQDVLGHISSRSRLADWKVSDGATT